YHPDKDLVLLMDVARYKYPPHWVPLTLLYSSICRLDPVTSQSRGWMLIKKSNETKSLLFFNNDMAINSVRSNQNNNSYQNLLEEASKLENINLRNEKLINLLNPLPNNSDYDIANIYYNNLIDCECCNQCQCTENEVDAIYSLFKNLPFNNIYKIFT